MIAHIPISLPMQQQEVAMAASQEPTRARVWKFSESLGFYTFRLRVTKKLVVLLRLQRKKVF